MEGFNQNTESFGSGRVNGGDTYLISNLLSRAIADGIARIGSEYSFFDWASQGEVTVCRNGWCSRGPVIFDSSPQITNWTCTMLMQYRGFDEPCLDPSKMLSNSFPQPANVDQNWTRITMPIHRYGYGYGFSGAEGGTPVKIAAAVLLFDALIILLHCGFVIFYGQSFAFTESLGELLRLALRSRPTAAASADDTTTSDKSIWTKPTRIRAVHGNDGRDRLEMLVGSDDGDNDGGSRRQDRDLEVDETALSAVRADKKYI